MSLTLLPPKTIATPVTQPSSSPIFVPPPFSWLTRRHTYIREFEGPQFSESFGVQVKQGLKRCIDILLSLILLAVSAPILIILAIGTRLNSPGPVLYKQERMGKHGKHFDMYKFRSMPIDTESLSGIQWACEAETDERVDAWGKFLRITRGDELPQLFNILKGDMSLIGPRPERPYYVEQFKEMVPHYYRRHSVRPGLCGYAQVINPYLSTAQIAYKTQLDVYYIQHWTLALEVWIVLRALDYVWPTTYRVMKMWGAKIYKPLQVISKSI